MCGLQYILNMEQSQYQLIVNNKKLSMIRIFGIQGVAMQHLNKTILGRFVTRTSHLSQFSYVECEKHLNVSNSERNENCWLLIVCFEGTEPASHSIISGCGCEGRTNLKYFRSRLNSFISNAYHLLIRLETPFLCPVFAFSICNL